MEMETGGRKFAIERDPIATNRFYIFELAGGKRILAGEGIFSFYERDKISLRNIEIKPPFRGALGAALIRGAYGFLAQAFPERKTMRYYKLVPGKPRGEKKIDLERLRAKASRQPRKRRI